MKVHVVRVFVDHDGGHGNPLGVILDAARLSDEDKQAASKELGYSETVFVENAEQGKLRIFTTQHELPFAGHPMVGAAWFLGRETGAHPASLHTPKGSATTWLQDDIVWVRSLLRDTPSWWHERLAGVKDVESLTGPLAPEQDATQLWAWDDEGTGKVRARTFAARFGIEEDEATGSAAMRLAAALGTRLTIRHGRGSIVYAAPGVPGRADVGGRVAEDEPREI